MPEIMTVKEFMCEGKPLRIVAPLSHLPSAELVTEVVKTVHDLCVIMIENEKLESTKLEVDEAMVSLAVSASIESIRLLCQTNDGKMRII